MFLESGWTESRVVGQESVLESLRLFKAVGNLPFAQTLYRSWLRCRWRVLLCESVREIKRTTSTDAIIDIRHEQFIQTPRDHLKELCEFLGVEAPPDYLADCASIVYESHHRSRHDEHFRWSASLIDEVKRGIDRYPFLAGYSFDSD